MSESIAQFIAHRVEALAYVSLTRRPDVTVTRLGEAGELDLLANIRALRSRQMRYVGVTVKGTARHLDEADASKVLRTAFRADERSGGPIQYPFPVVALVFSMDDDQGFFQWRVKPSVRDGVPTLEAAGTFDCKRFTKAQFDSAVDAANEWYDAAFATFHSLVT